MLIAGLAAGAVAAAGIIVAVGGSNGSGGSGGSRGSGRRQVVASATPRELDARSFLLASAETAAKAPETTGAYWYIQERRTELFDGKHLPKPAPKFGKGPRIPPVIADIGQTWEIWNGRDLHNRRIRGIDRKIDFATSADEATWKSMGSPDLAPWSAKREVEDSDLSSEKLSSSDRHLTVPALTKLPAMESSIGPIGPIRLTIDGAMGQLLAQEAGDRTKPVIVITYEKTGWVNRIGERP